MRLSVHSLALRFLPLTLLVGACGTSQVLPATSAIPGGIYARADSVALTVPPRADRAIGSLARALTADLPSDREKTRAIYRWMTENIAYDRDAFLAGDIGHTSPREVLRDRRAVCDGYARLFEALARRAGIPVVTIEGYAKAFGYHEGTGFDRPNHKWNAVFLDGEWLLVDATWGAGYMEDARWVRAFDDRFFLTPPERMIVTHLPSDPSWQLLDASISMQEFLELPIVPQTVQRLGASLDEVRRVTADPRFRGFVAVYDTDGLDVSFHRMPIERNLRASATHVFELAGEAIEAVILSNRVDRYRFEPSGDVFTKSIQLEPGEWRIMAQPRGVDYTVTLLRYQVEE